MLFNFSFYTLICIFFLGMFSKRHQAAARAGIIAWAVLTMIWLWVVLAFREPAGDPWRYMLGLNHIAGMSFDELLSYDRTPIGFGLLNWLTAIISTDSALFFSVVYFFCVIPLYLAFRERVNRVDAAILMMLYLLYPFYINYMGSGFKQGIAFGFMLWGFNCIVDREDPNWPKGLLLLFTATLFHSSFWLFNLVIAAWYLVYRRLPIRWALWTLGGCVLLSMAGLSEPLSLALLPQSMIDNLGYSSYFDQEFLTSEEYLNVGYKAGFRLDFTIFTLSPLLLIAYIKKTDASIGSDEHLKVYALLASIYMLLVFIPYSDRIAAFSWFMAPFIIFIELSRPHNAKRKTNFVFIMIASYPFLMTGYTKAFFQ